MKDTYGIELTLLKTERRKLGEMDTANNTNHGLKKDMY